MATIIMAVGRGLGPWYDPEKPEKDQPEYYEIAEGRLVGEFTYDQTMVWDAAHQRVDLHGQHKFNRAELERAAKEVNEIADPGPAVDFLLSEGVLVEIDLESSMPVDFFKKYRLLPQGTGYGNFKDKRDLYALGIRGDILVPVSHRAKAVWQLSYLEGSIWDGCKSLSKAYRRRGSDFPPEAFADEIRMFLPAIVATTVGVLEQAR